MADYCGYCDQKIPVPQSRLSRTELEQFDYEDAYGFPNVLKLQVVKGHAEYFDVSDWVAHVDSSLSMGENIARMEELGQPSMRDVRRLADGGTVEADAGVDGDTE